MFKRLILIGLLAISGSAMLETEAGARTCALRSSSGTCLIWSGSVEGDIVTDSQGSVQQRPMIDFEIHPTGDGVIICANSGAKKKPAPGIQVVTVNLATDNFNFAAPPQAIQKSNIKDGVAAVTAFAFLSPAQLDALRVNCPNTGWTVEDGVPCDADIHIRLRNDKGTIDEVSYQCTLNTVNFSCENLQWIEEEHRFERRQYECTLQP